MSKTINLVGVGSSRRYLAKDGTYSEAWTAEEASGVTQGLGQYFYSNDYVIYRFTNKIDTRIIPAWATIVSATVTFTLSYNGTTIDFDMVIQLLAPVSEVPDNTWYNKEYFSGNGGSSNTAGISGLVTIPFNEAGLTWIQKEDYTKLGVRSSRDIAGIAPTGLEYFTYSGYIYYNVTYIAVPAVTTNPATNIEENQATGWGKITQVHDDVDCDKIGICYNKTGNPTIADSKVEEDGTFWNNKTFAKVLTGLDPGTTYYFKAYSRNPTGYGYGIEREFTTAGEPPVCEVTTQAVTDIIHNSATGNGTITDIGGEDCTKRGICWNITGNPTIADNKSEETGSFGVGAFTRQITGLIPEQLYHVKAYAYNPSGYAYGNEVEFTTLPAIPVVTTQPVTDIEIRTATANGTIISGIEISERGFEYGLTETPAKSVKEEGIDLGLGPYSLSLTKL